MLAFPTNSSLVVWDCDGKLVGDILEETDAIMVGLLLKKEPVAAEGELWADAVDWEACKAEEVKPREAPSREGLEVVHLCNPNTSKWVDLTMSLEEASCI